MDCVNFVREDIAYGCGCCEEGGGSVLLGLYGCNNDGLGRVSAGGAVDEAKSDVLSSSSSLLDDMIDASGMRDFVDLNGQSLLNINRTLVCHANYGRRSSPIYPLRLEHSLTGTSNRYEQAYYNMIQTIVQPKTDSDSWASSSEAGTLRLVPFRSWSWHI